VDNRLEVVIYNDVLRE